MRKPPVACNKEGFSLVEVMIAMVLFALGIMSLAGAATLGLSQMGGARQDLQYSADVQQIADSLVNLGFNGASTGTCTIRGRPVNWTVSSVSPRAQRIDVVVERQGQANMAVIYRDTVTLFVAKNQVQ
jgi:prepilin-type N-terminal cleavage/methylation domain-containing protein